MPRTPARYSGKHIQEWQERVREKIRTSQIVDTLIAFAEGPSTKGGKPVDLTREQLRAIEILLKKTLPDLQSIQLTGDKEKPVELKFTWET